MGKEKEPRTSNKESQVRLAITAARDLSAIREGRCANIIRPPSFSESSSIQANGRAAQQLYASTLGKAGFDAEEFERIRAQNQIDMRRFAEEKKAEGVKCAAAGQHALLQGIDSRRKTMGVLASSSDPFYVTLEKPFLIWARHLNVLGETHVELWNSWAKFKFDSGKTSGAEEFTFYYLWENPSDRHALVNIDGYLVATGHLQTGQNGGNFPGNRFANVTLTGHLYPLEWWNQPPTSPVAQTDQSQQIAYLATGDGGGWGNPGEIDVANVFRGCDVRYGLFLLPPHGVTVIEVTLTVSYNTGRDSGHVYVDFETGDFKVMSPFVLIAVLT